MKAIESSPLLAGNSQTVFVFSTTMKGDFIRMKKHLVIGVALLVVIASVAFLYLSFASNQGVSKSVVSQKKDKDKISFSLLERYDIDTSGMRNRLRIKQGKPFTCFVQITVFENLYEYFTNEYHTEIPEIEFSYQDKYMLISFGRKVEEIAYEFLGEPYAPNTVAIADITFSEEYSGEVMFVYAMDKIYLFDNLDDGNSYYIMNGTEKEFYGHSIFDLNEREPWVNPGD